MTTSSSRTARFRLEIRRAGECFETYGLFESIEPVQLASEGDVVGCGDCMRGSSYRTWAKSSTRSTSNTELTDAGAERC